MITKRKIYFVFIANYLLESIDANVEPCENFFKFACGTWLKNNRIPDDSKPLFLYCLYLPLKILFYFKPVLKIHSMCYELN
jgi:hypothetical protein